MTSPTNPTSHPTPQPATNPTASSATAPCSRGPGPEDPIATIDSLGTLTFSDGAVASALIDTTGRVVWANQACVEFLGVPHHEVVGRQAVDFIHPEDAVRLVPRRIRSGELDRVVVERRFLRPSSGDAWALVNLSGMCSSSGEFSHMFVQMQDITERKRAEELLAHEALHDSVTGLANRALIEDRLEGALGRARRYGRKVAVVFADIDRFSLVNDTLGHQAGDELLAEVARRISQAIPAGDSVGRFGGDEFVVICEDVEAGTRPETLGESVRSLFLRPFEVAGQPVFATISCGVAVAGPDDTAESCLRDADNAALVAKQRGRNRTETFHPQLRATAQRMLVVENALRRAIDEDELSLAYQPIIDLQTGLPVAVEALIRWQPAGGDPISPSEFIPLAEQSDLILRIGEFALATAVSDITSWRQRFEAAKQLSVAVNLAPRQLNADLLPLCEDALAASGADACALTVEITERGVMADVHEATRVLEALAAAGIRISIDDFGTGYSSLEYLKHIPANVIKIDAAFIAELGPGTQDSAIVKAIVELAGAIGMQSCAEGVETTEQLEELVALGCRYGQGYFWQRPMPASDFETWLASLTPETTT